VPKQFVRDIRPGDRVDSTFYLEKMILLPFRDATRGTYLTLTLTDKTGQIQGRVWEGAAAMAAALAERKPARVVALAEDFQGQVQLRVEQATLIERPEPSLLADFVPTSPSDLHRLRAQLEKVILSVHDEHLARLLRWFFTQKEYYEAYTTSPAAKQVHHSYLGGLLEHSLEVVELCEAACRVAPALQRDLLVTAALLHDMGKIHEYSWAAPPAIDLTDEGRLIGHTAIGLRMLDGAVASLRDFPRPVAEHLAHLLLSHHGELTSGAPVLPQTLEAMALHLADLASAKLKQCEQVLGTSADAGWTQYDRLLGRAMYSGFGRVKRGAAADATDGADDSEDAGPVEGRAVEQDRKGQVLPAGAGPREGEVAKP
jgi:3'-5' exoribonuclease